MEIGLWSVSLSSSSDEEIFLLGVFKWAPSRVGAHKVLYWINAQTLKHPDGAVEVFSFRPKWTWRSRSTTTPSVISQRGNSELNWQLSWQMCTCKPLTFLQSLYSFTFIVDMEMIYLPFNRGALSQIPLNCTASDISSFKSTITHNDWNPQIKLFYTGFICSDGRARDWQTHQHITSGGSAVTRMINLPLIDCWVIWNFTFNSLMWHWQKLLYQRRSSQNNDGFMGRSTPVLKIDWHWFSGASNVWD